MSDSLQRYGLQHTRLPYSSTTPRACSNSCPLSRWCHPTISSSVIPISSCLQSFPASGSFQMSQLFASGGQSIGVSASASVFPMNIQDWFPLGLTGLISLQSKGLSRVFSSTTEGAALATFEPVVPWEPSTRTWLSSQTILGAAPWALHEVRNIDLPLLVKQLHNGSFIYCVPVMCTCV